MINRWELICVIVYTKLHLSLIWILTSHTACVRAVVWLIVLYNGYNSWYIFMHYWGAQQRFHYWSVNEIGLNSSLTLPHSFLILTIREWIWYVNLNDFKNKNSFFLKYVISFFPFVNCFEDGFFSNVVPHIFIFPAQLHVIYL